MRVGKLFFAVKVTVYLQYIFAVAAGVQQALLPKINNMRQVFLQVYLGNISKNIANGWVDEQPVVKFGKQEFEVGAGLYVFHALSWFRQINYAHGFIADSDFFFLK